jgi:hypothetical protein
MTVWIYDDMKQFVVLVVVLELEQLMESSITARDKPSMVLYGRWHSEGITTSQCSTANGGFPWKTGGFTSDVT